MTFATKVRALIRSRRLTQLIVAETLDVQQPVVSRWLKLDTPPTDRKRLVALARLLGVSTDYLLDDAREAPGGTELTFDQRSILAVVKALGLSHDEAVRRLTGSPKFDGGHPGRDEGQARMLRDRPEDRIDAR